MVCDEVESPCVENVGSKRKVPEAWRELWSPVGFHNLTKKRTCLSADGKSPSIKERWEAVWDRDIESRRVISGVRFLRKGREQNQSTSGLTGL